MPRGIPRGMAAGASDCERVADVIADLDWSSIGASLDAQGFAKLPAILSPGDCESLAALYTNDAHFRSRIDMARFRFGVGEYKYFAAPLPAIVQTLREDLYAHLAPIANRWSSSRRGGPTCPPRGRHTGRPLQRDEVYPPTLDRFLRTCHSAGQTRPTPLLLSYAAGGYNCLHQDIYGELAFPLQVVFVLSRLGVDYTGGELLLVEQRPRAQSRGHAVAVDQGAAVVFATRERPVEGTRLRSRTKTQASFAEARHSAEGATAARGTYRVVMRHGVSALTSGTRMSLGIIFHDGR